MALTKLETETTIFSNKNRENIWNIISDFSQYSKIMKNNCLIKNLKFM